MLINGDLGHDVNNIFHAIDDLAKDTVGLKTYTIICNVDVELGIAGVRLSTPRHTDCPTGIAEAVVVFVDDIRVRRRVVEQLCITWISAPGARLNNAVRRWGNEAVDDQPIVKAVGNILKEVIHSDRRVGRIKLQGNLAEIGIEHDDRVFGLDNRTDE